MVERPEDTNLDTLLSANLYDQDPQYANYRRQHGIQLASNDLPNEVTKVAQGTMLIPPQSPPRPPIAPPPSTSSKAAVDAMQSQPPPTAPQPAPATAQLPALVVPPYTGNKLVDDLMKDSPAPATPNGDMMDVDGSDSRGRGTSGTPGPSYASAEDRLKRRSMSLKDRTVLKSMTKANDAGDTPANGVSTKPKLQKSRSPNSKQRPSSPTKSSVPEEIRGYQLAGWRSLVYKKPVSSFLQTAPKVLSTKDWQVAREEQKHFKLLSRIEVLEKEGTWAFKQRVPHQPPPRHKSHHDLLLDEMKWLGQDFREERKWKIAMCFKLARWVLEWHAAEDKSTVCVDRRQHERSAAEMMDLDFLAPQDSLPRRSLSLPKDTDNAMETSEDDAMATVKTESDSTKAPEIDVPEASTEEERAWKGRDTEPRVGVDPSSIMPPALSILTSRSRKTESPALVVDPESLVYIVTSSFHLSSPPEVPSMPVFPKPPPVVIKQEVPPPAAESTTLDQPSVAPTSITPSSQPSVVTQPPPVVASTAPVLPIVPLPPTINITQATPPLALSQSPALQPLAPSATPPQQPQAPVIAPLPIPKIMLPAPDTPYQPFDTADLYYDPMPYHRIIPVSNLMSTKFIVKDNHRYDKYGRLQPEDVLDIDEEVATALPSNERYNAALFTSPLFIGRRIKDDKGFEPQPSAHQNDPSRVVVPWTTEEEDMLLTLVAQYPSNWDLVADTLASCRLGPPQAIRTAHDCFIRWGRAIKEQKANAAVAANEAAAASDASTPIMSPSTPFPMANGGASTHVNKKQKLESQHSKSLRRDEQKRIKRHSAVFDLIRQYAEQREANKPPPARPPKQINMTAHDTHQQSQLQAGVNLDSSPLTPVQLGMLKERRDKEIRSSHEQMRMMGRPPGMGAPMGYGPAYPNYRIARPAVPLGNGQIPLRPPGQPMQQGMPQQGGTVTATPLPTNVTPVLQQSGILGLVGGMPRPQLSQADLGRLLMAQQQRQQAVQQAQQQQQLRPPFQQQLTPQQMQQIIEQQQAFAALPAAQRQLLINRQQAAAAAGGVGVGNGVVRPQGQAPPNPEYLQALGRGAVGTVGPGGLPSLQFTPELLQQLNLQRAQVQQHQQQQQVGTPSSTNAPQTPGPMSPNGNVAASPRMGTAGASTPAAASSPVIEMMEDVIPGGATNDNSVENSNQIVDESETSPPHRETRATRAAAAGTTPGRSSRKRK
ncbi:hypothetical protein SmJEL517_g05598 [Synchytrium microbalum]|uniref:Vacuolar import and degradation protein 21 n=1 Tax=Synchytrium microbalum TaxID=1806994 RepID=A0A507BKA2_9FUNG|nr:uncharacterized protein SmJEL517_g05598 [Synchytrium microbalum]TPX30930.1 hypothetical protein SmJEL517_g05598 [Synchytrium microbalum]